MKIVKNYVVTLSTKDIKHLLNIAMLLTGAEYDVSNHKGATIIMSKESATIIADSLNAIKANELTSADKDGNLVIKIDNMVT